MTPPSHIGQYRIIRKIGAGGMGLVYLGEHTLLGRRAAIKTLLPTVAANHEIVERFFNEARATSAIADPGVIQIFDFGYHVDGTAYIVMELLEGEALSARLERLGKLPLADVLRFGRQIAGSLAAAHAHDIVHRDLKPENIFLVRDPEAQGGERTKIIDFGICKMGAGDPMLTEVGAMIGTPVYMSPEQCRGSGEIDQRSDVYALGCLLFHLLTGRPPFVGEGSGDLIIAHLQEEPPPPSRYVPGLPPAIDALLLCCLAKAPRERFASMTALQTALGAVKVEAESAAPPVAAPPPTVPLGRGFRSVFDANLAAALGDPPAFGDSSSSPIPLALRSRLRFAPPPEITPRPDDIDELDPPPRRAGVRAALACVLVVGVALGLIVTPLLVGERSQPVSARAVRPAALPVDDSRAGSRAALPVAADDPPAEDRAALPAPAPRPSERAVASTSESPPDPPHEPRRPPRPSASKPAPPRTHAGAGSRAAAAPRPSRPATVQIAPDPPLPRFAASQAPRPAPPPATATASVAAPAATGPAVGVPPPPPPAAAAPSPPPLLPAAAAPVARPLAAAPPPAARPAPSPPSEDLYDTR